MFDSVLNELFAYGSRRRNKLRRPWVERVGYMTELIKEAQSIAGAPIYPISNNGAQYTGTVDMSKFFRVQFLCYSGTVGGGGNVVYQLQQTNNSNGASNTNVVASNTGTGTSVTLNGSSQTGTIECRSDQLSARYAQVSQVINTNASVAGCTPEAYEPRLHPSGGATSQDVSSVISRVYA